MDKNYEEIVIDTENKTGATVGDSLYQSRVNACESRYNSETPTASIVVFCYNRLEKTRRCIESIIENTQDVSHELIFVDNGSTDGTYEYLCELPVKKKIIKITKNIGALFPFFEIQKLYQGKYYIGVPNDVIVTSRWLSNLLKCYGSDSKIGFVAPCSTNVSNLQQVSKQFRNWEEMKKWAEKNNISDPRRWKQRLRLINIVTVIKREVFDLVGFFDYGFFHDFGEDDFAVRIRRAGYKLMLCEDSFVHHDHDFRNMEDKDPQQYQLSLDMGMKNYKDKYCGLDPWEDVNNFETNLLDMISIKGQYQSVPEILGIDVRMGTPILEIKNRLREKGFFNCVANAFTTQAKYFTDLQTICGRNVYCDRIDYIFESFSPNTFDYVIVGEPINTYAEPVKLLQRLIEFTKEGGQILIKLKNLNSINKFVQILGGGVIESDSMYVNIDVNELVECIKLMGINDINVSVEFNNVDQDTEKIIKSIVKNAGVSKDIVDTTNRVKVNNYLLSLKK